MWMNTFWTDAVIDVLLFVYVVDCIFMGLVIMMQRSKQEGLGAAFGGGFTESVWGAQTSQVLVKATVGATILFFILSISLARLDSHRAVLMDEGSAVQQQLLKPVIPAKPAGSTTPLAKPMMTPTNSVELPVAPIPASTKSPQPATTDAKPAGK
jgi:preprotein translocase subunit SecG